MILKLGRAGQIGWPPECAVCGSRDIGHQSTHKSKIMTVGFYFIVTRWQWNTLTINYPLCARHRIRSAWIYFLSPGSVFWKYYFLGLALFPVVDYFAKRLLWSGTGLIVSACFLALGVAALLAIRLAPVRIVDFDAESATIGIRSPEYAENFDKLNHNLVIERNGYRVT